MKMDDKINKKQKTVFKTAEITKMLGIKRTTLQTWVDNGYVWPSVQRADKPGTNNIYNILDLYRIAIFDHMTGKRGFSRRQAAEFIKELTEDYTFSVASRMKLALFFKRQDSDGWMPVIIRMDDQFETDDDLSRVVDFENDPEGSGEVEDPKAVGKDIASIANELKKGGYSVRNHFRAIFDHSDDVFVLNLHRIFKVVDEKIKS